MKARKIQILIRGTRIDILFYSDEHEINALNDTLLSCLKNYDTTLLEYGQSIYLAGCLQLLSPT